MRLIVLFIVVVFVAGCVRRSEVLQEEIVADIAPKQISISWKSCNSAINSIEYYIDGKSIGYDEDGLSMLHQRLLQLPDDSDVIFCTGGRRASGDSLPQGADYPLFDQSFTWSDLELLAERKNLSFTHDTSRPGQSRNLVIPSGEPSLRGAAGKSVSPHISTSVKAERGAADEF